MDNRPSRQIRTPDTGRELEKTDHQRPPPNIWKAEREADEHEGTRPLSAIRQLLT